MITLSPPRDAISLGSRTSARYQDDSARVEYRRAIASGPARPRPGTRAASGPEARSGAWTLTGSPDCDVLIIEDDQDQLRLIARVMEGACFNVARAVGAERGHDVLTCARPKVVLCDYELPDGDGAELCRAARQSPETASCYFILMSASAECKLPFEVLRAGADDYLTKPTSPEEIISRVRVGIRMSTMHDQLRRAAITDGLTGLYNHDHFNRLLETEVGRSRRYGHPLALIMIDLDFFKAINDTFGHLAGNRTLEAVAEVLRSTVRDVDLVARFGGEEFVVILPQATTADAVQVAERVRETLADSLRIEALHNHVVTASFGISDSDDHRVGCAADLVDLADRALYVAKQRGRNEVACSCELEEGAELAATIKTDEIESLRRRLTALSVRAKDIYMQSVASLLQALDEKDPFTARHAANTSFYARRIAEQMGCSKSAVKAVQNAALLHDIGKIGVPDRILMKRAPLTDLERMVIEQVPLIGTRIVDHLRILEAEVQIIRHQRERYDGSGFPAGLHGSQIPVGARILLVADAFDAITTDRVYRQRKSLDDALAEMHRGAGKQFDPRAVTALRQLLDRDRAEWEQRIEQTIHLMRMPAEMRITPAAEFIEDGPNDPSVMAF